MLQELVYFDNAATTQKPQSVIDGISNYYKSYNANIHRGIHSLAEKATEEFEETRSLVKKFINASNKVLFLKLSIISYDTRIFLKQFAKSYDTQKIFPEQINCKRPILSTEEDRALIGVLLENLITCNWIGRWPSLPDLSVIKNNPMYTHCIKRIEKLHIKYKKSVSGIRFDSANISQELDVILAYSQLHQAMFNKIYCQN